MAARRAREAEIAVVRPAQPRSTPQAVAGATERRLPGALEVPIDQVVPDPSQPRKDWEHDGGAARLQELASSIAEFGILQPLLVREAGTLYHGQQRYVIIAGARRREAAARVGLTMIPVVVRGEESSRIRVLQLVENLQRQSLSPLDEARAYQELIDMEGLTAQALAERLHISGQHVRDRLRLLADQVLADAVERRQISATAAREMMKLPDEEVISFKQRVQAGERLQTNDVAVARARLEAEGIVNPRRKVVRQPRAALLTPPAQPGGGERAEPAERQRAVPEPSAQDKTTFYPDAVEPAASVALREPERAGDVMSLSVSGTEEATPESATGLTEEQRADARVVAATLDAALRGRRRELVIARLAAMKDVASLADWWLHVFGDLWDLLES